MSMFCFQCQETMGNKGCSAFGVCGKTAEVANLQDALVHTLRKITLCHEKAEALGIRREGVGAFLADGLFRTVTNVNFDPASLGASIEQARSLGRELRALVVERAGAGAADGCPTFDEAEEAGVLSTEDADVRALRELLVYGLKGIAAYAHHAAVLGREDRSVYDFLVQGLASTTRDLSQEEMLRLVLKAGEVAMTTMATLDAANTEAYGDPEITEVNLGVRDRPGILISGHDLKDLEELLEQTEGTGVDVYTHGEMLPAHYYPAFKKHDHLAGNYGGSWHEQTAQFESFNGPILMTTNCLVPPQAAYRDRLYTTGTVAFPGIKHIPGRRDGGGKDFGAIIEQARRCRPPTQLESGTIVGGFAHKQVLDLADRVVGAVKSGAIKKFVVMAGCDGRQRSRGYFTEVARSLPDDTVILTAGCAKYRYNKLDLGDIGGIPRVLDAGQCNDSYSLAVVALKLKEIFEVEEINDLPIEFDIAWYEQKAVAVLLALLHLGFKGIRLGPTLPAFLSPNVARVLVERFDIMPTGEVADDVAAMTG
jgi:hydroxylamine reductase